MPPAISTLLVLFVFCTQSRLAQSSQPSSVASSSRTLVVTAISKDSSVIELRAEDLELKESGKLAVITAVRKLGHLPLHYCVVFDMSGSEKATFSFQQHEASSLLGKIIKPATDRGWISLFKDETQESTEVSDPKQIVDLISQLTPPGPGGTALYDAMAGCARRMAKAPETQPVLRTMFVFSDGGEDASNLSMDQMTAIVTEARFHVFALTPKSELEAFAKRRFERLTKRIGGRAFTLHNEDGLQKAIDQVGHDIDNSFEITYTSGSDKTGRLKIELKSRNKNLEVVAPEETSVAQ